MKLLGILSFLMPFSHTVCHFGRGQVDDCTLLNHWTGIETFDENKWVTNFSKLNSHLIEVHINLLDLIENRDYRYKTITNPSLHVAPAARQDELEKQNRHFSYR